MMTSFTAYWPTRGRPQCLARCLSSSFTLLAGRAVRRALDPQTAPTTDRALPDWRTAMVKTSRSAHATGSAPTAASARNLVRFKHLDFAMRRPDAESRTPRRQYEASSLNGYLRARSWMHVRRVAEVETDRFHHPERRARGEDIACRQDVLVLLDQRRGGGVGEGVEIALHTCPGVLAVLREVGRRIERVECRPDAVGEVCHVLLMKRHVIAGADPAQVAADVVLPRVRERVVGRLDVALDVFREVRQVHRRPPRVDDVDKHERVVIRQMDEGEIRRVARAM